MLHIILYVHKSYYVIACARFRAYEEEVAPRGYRVVRAAVVHSLALNI